MNFFNQSVTTSTIYSILPEHPATVERAEPLDEAAIREWAYRRYLERLQSDLPGTPEDDWQMGEQLALIERIELQLNVNSARKGGRLQSLLM